MIDDFAKYSVSKPPQLGVSSEVTTPITTTKSSSTDIDSFAQYSVMPSAIKQAMPFQSAIAVQGEKQKSIWDLQGLDIITQPWAYGRSPVESLLKAWGSAGDIFTHPQNFVQNVKNIVAADVETVMFPYLTGAQILNNFSQLGTKIYDVSMPQPTDTQWYLPKEFGGGVTREGLNRLEATVLSTPKEMLLGWLNNYRFIPSSIATRLPDNVINTVEKFIIPGAALKTDAQLTAERRKGAAEDWQQFKDYAFYQPQFLALDVLATSGFGMKFLDKAGITTKIVKAVPENIAKVIRPPLSPSSPLGKLGVAEDIRKLRSTVPQGIATGRALQVSKLGIKQTVTQGVVDKGLRQTLQKPLEPYLKGSFREGYVRNLDLTDSIGANTTLGQAVDMVIAGNKSVIPILENAKKVLGSGTVRHALNNKLVPAVVKAQMAGQGSVFKELLQDVYKAIDLDTLGRQRIVVDTWKLGGRKQAITVAKDFVDNGHLTPLEAKQALYEGKFYRVSTFREAKINKLFPDYSLSRFATMDDPLHRSYMFYEKKGWKPTPEMLDVVKKHLTNDLEMTPVEADGLIYDVLENKNVPITVGKRVIAAPAGSGALKFRTVQDPVLRKYLLGEITEAKKQVLDTVSNQMQLINSGKIFDKWAKNPNLVHPLEGGKVTGPRVGYVKIENRPELGALNNRLVKAELVEELVRTAKDLPWILKGYQQVLNGVKSALTIYNIGGHGRNVGWDLILKAQLGITDSAVMEFARAMKRKSHLYYKALNNGVIHASMSNEVNLSILDEMSQGNSWVSAVGKVGKKIEKIGSDAWQYPDDLLKGAEFIQRMREGKDVLSAAELVRRHQPYYDTVSPLIQGLRMLPLPFATFTFETFRSTLINSAMDYPVRTAIIAELPQMANLYQKKALDFTDKEYKDLTRMMPTYLQNGTYVIIAKKGKKVYLQDLSSVSGLQNVTRLLPQANMGTPLDMIMKTGANWIQNPLLDKYITLQTGQTSFGYDVAKTYEKVMPGGESQAKLSSIVSGTLPSSAPIVGSIWQKMLRKTDVGPGIVALQYAGIKIVEVDLIKAAYWNRVGLLKTRKEILSGIKQVQSAVNAETMSRDEGNTRIKGLIEQYKKTK